MNGLPYYKAYPRDFIEGTVGMDFEMKAAYRLVLDLIYMQGGKLPDEPRYIAGLLGCSVKKWNGLRERLISAGKIEVRGAYLGNLRADKELETLGKLQDQQRENRSRPNKNKTLQSPPSNHTEPDTDTEKSIPTTSGEAPSIKPVEVDPVNKATWDLGISMLAPSGDKQAVKAARSNIGRWLKGRTPVEVLAALNEARKSGTMDPLPYVEAVLKNGGKKAKLAGWIDPVTGHGVEQFHPHAQDMGGGWWARPDDDVEWYKNTNDCRPNKWVRARQEAEQRAALSGCING